MFFKLPLADSIEHVASDAELAEYRQRRRRAGSNFFDIAGYLRTATHSELQRALWSRARENLISGEWTAQGFLDGKPTIPHYIHQDLWRFLEPDTAFKCAAGGGFSFCGILVSGKSRSTELGDASPVLPSLADGEKRESETFEDVSEERVSRSAIQAGIRTLFEKLDKELPLYEY
ncbi:MAG: hypothetical protein EON58_20725 [Alphaproteobacteria bacterium]|nr:MAG: hypothetical protein EON58_20725 [Alphaproteobacteria bacterium]